jgi:glycosyltransferase involved in cell wall biosynthesis
LVLVEAMRAGVAVIGTDAGGVSEIIEHEQSGLLFEPGNVEQLAAYLRRLVDSSDYKISMAQHGKARADELFAEQKHFDELEQILSGVSS